MDKKPDEKSNKKPDTKFNPTAYKNSFRDKTYDRVEVALPKGRKAVLKEKAKDNGMSVSEYINSLF